ncbi:hypothetical protein V8C35DRAFT_308980 [Trichoderma chlorosporum]
MLYGFAVFPFCRFHRQGPGNCIHGVIVMAAITEREDSTVGTRKSECKYHDRTP